MADPVAVIDVDNLPENGAGDVDMEGAGEAEEVEAARAENGDDVAVAPETEEVPPKRIMFIDYLRSPIVELVIGNEEEQTVLSAHQDLLTKSPFFEQACADFTGAAQRCIELPDEDLDAMGCFLEYLYNGEYFPRRLGEGRDSRLETDASLPELDDTGEQLLRHARVYTLADRFFMPELKSLAHSKIHRTSSSARGEIVYARYVYAFTSPQDTAIRKPVAAFWATRSHVLRHQAEEEFRAMCLEYPQFGFDVLSLVLDQKEKHIEPGGTSAILDTPGGSGRGRKRARVSAIV